MGGQQFCAVEPTLDLTNTDKATAFALYAEQLLASAGYVHDPSDVALGLGGSYNLAYHRWARRDQLEAAYPQILDFVEAKEARDAKGIFRSDWYHHVLALFDGHGAA
jgi:hypothetical protein